jgi:hypothetical protein
MRTMTVALTVSGLMACLLCTGCVSGNKATNLSLVNNQTVMVVPVQGEPVALVSQHLGTALAGGMVGVAIEQGATGSARERLAARLNRDAGDFKPEVMLAEECAQLLKDSPVPAFRSATLHAEPVLLPEEKELLMKETSPFKGETSTMPKWGALTHRWRTGPPLAVSRQQGAGDSALVCLEVRFTWLQINHGNKLDVAIWVRLVDQASQKVIGVRYVSRDGYKIRPVTTDSDPAAFKEDFRRLAHQMAKEALTKMKLL